MADLCFHPVPKIDGEEIISGCSFTTPMLTYSIFAI